jgi:hypothetical protein
MDFIVYLVTARQFRLIARCTLDPHIAVHAKRKAAFWLRMARTAPAPRLP